VARRGICISELSIAIAYWQEVGGLSLARSLHLIELLGYRQFSCKLKRGPAARVKCLVLAFRISN
jgi:hypothetical protein